MGNINPVPQNFRERLEAENWKVGRSEIHQTFVSTDGTLKVAEKLLLAQQPLILTKLTE